MVGGLVMSHAVLPPSDQVQAEAAAWLVRLHRDERPDESVRGFQVWLAAEPSHAVAFEAVNGTWDIAGGIPRDMRGQYRTRSVNRRRAALTAASAAVAVAA